MVGKPDSLGSPGKPPPLNLQLRPGHRRAAASTWQLRQFGGHCAMENRIRCKMMPAFTWRHDCSDWNTIQPRRIEHGQHDQWRAQHRSEKHTSELQSLED